MSVDFARDNRSLILLFKLLFLSMPSHSSNSSAACFNSCCSQDANLVLNSIVFASNSAELTPGSLGTLDRIKEFMALNPGIKIEVPFEVLVLEAVWESVPGAINE